MKYAGLHFLLGVSLALLAWLYPGVAGLLGWLGACFGMLSLAYALRRPTLLGKRRDGSLSWWSWILFLPLHLITWGIWHAVRVLSREPAFHQITPQLIVGRRLLASEVPPEIELIVDLTSEFTEPAGVRKGRRYQPLPILDASVPELKSLYQVIDSLPQVPTYIHCAQGHGRTGLFTSVYLVRRGHCKTLEEAMDLLAKVRRGIVLNAEQKAFIHTLSAAKEASTTD